MTEQMMIIRYPLTVLTFAALVMASGLTFAGGMPSDEGPEVILDDLGFNDGDKALDGDTITAIINSNRNPPIEPLQTPFIPAAYVTTVVVADDVPVGRTQARDPKLVPARINPEDDMRRDHR